MGLHSPFGYVGYEVRFAEIFIDILDKLCAHCHTDDDYRTPRGRPGEGCHQCPAGNLAFECKNCIIGTEEEDKHHEFYASDEWVQRRVAHGYSEPTKEEREKELQMAADYKAESEVLRAMKQKIKRIIPHPFFYIRHHRKYPYERPKVFNDFVELAKKYATLKENRLQKWGLSEAKISR